MTNRLILIAPLAAIAAACASSTSEPVATTMAAEQLPATADPYPVDANDTPGVPGNKYDDKDGVRPQTFDPAVNYRATGTDPYWTLNIGDKLTFANHDTGAIIVEPIVPPKNVGNTTTFENGRIKAFFTSKDCVDTKSGNRYPETAVVTVDGGTVRGCSGPISLFLDPSRNSDPGDLDIDKVK